MAKKKKTKGGKGTNPPPSDSSDNDDDSPFDAESVFRRLKEAKSKEGDGFDEGGIECDFPSSSDDDSGDVDDDDDFEGCELSDEECDIMILDPGEKKSDIINGRAFAGNEKKESNKSNNDDDNDDEEVEEEEEEEEEEDFLAKAAEDWAKKQEKKERKEKKKQEKKEEKEKKKRKQNSVERNDSEDNKKRKMGSEALTPLNSPPPAPRVLSIFVSKINYECKEDDVRRHFLAILKANNIVATLKSLRLVYDKDRTTFKGTAFIDFFPGDEEALKICCDKGNGSELMGRKIGVKPTMDKSQLASVVKTWEKGGSDGGGNQKKGGAKKGDSKKGDSKKNDSKKNDSKKNGKKKTQMDKDGGKNPQDKEKPKKPVRAKKLTKQDRAKKAAILASKK